MDDSQGKFAGNLADYVLPPEEVMLGGQARPFRLTLFDIISHLYFFVQDFEKHFGEIADEGLQLVIHPFTGEHGISTSALSRLLKDLLPNHLIVYDVNVTVIREVRVCVSFERCP